MLFSAEDKISRVLYMVDDAYVITPKNECSLIEESELKKYMSPIQYQQIIKKFEADERLITIQEYPTVKNCWVYKFIVNENRLREMLPEDLKIYATAAYNAKMKQLLKQRGKNHQEISHKYTEPVPIKILGETQIKITDFPSQQTENKNGFPHKLPSGTLWENIALKFETREQILIEVKSFKHHTTYQEMGFTGKGKKPSEAWAFLLVLAQLNGELKINVPEARDRYKKQKQILSDNLKQYFRIEYDPFHGYKSNSEKQGNSYKIKLILIPPQELDDSNSYTDSTPDDDFNNELRGLMSNNMPDKNEKFINSEK